MKKLLFVLAVIVVTQSCNKVGKELKERIIDADSIAINYFKGNGSMDTVIAVKIIKDKNTINQLVNFASAGSNSSINKCGYDGSLHFFKINRVIQDIDFRIGEGDCKQFTYFVRGKYYTSPLKDEASKLLMELRR